MTGYQRPEIGQIATIDGVEMIFEACNRCGGSGSFGPMVVDAAICWGCKVYYAPLRINLGAGGSWVDKADHDRRKHNRELAAARRVRKAAKIEAEKADRVAALIEAHPLLADMFAEGRDYSGPVGDMRARFERGTELSAKQIAFAEKLITEERATAAEPVAVPVPAGRLEVSGTVVSIKWKDGRFGGGYKITLATDDGFRVWGSLPTEINEDDVVGKKLAFTATLEPSRDDQTFGFFTRPAKARVL